MPQKIDEEQFKEFIAQSGETVMGKLEAYYYN